MEYYTIKKWVSKDKIVKNVPSVNTVHKKSLRKTLVVIMYNGTSNLQWSVIININSHCKYE
jgi:hypothetical protein